MQDLKRRDAVQERRGFSFSFNITQQPFDQVHEVVVKETDGFSFVSSRLSLL